MNVALPSRSENKSENKSGNDESGNGLTASQPDPDGGLTHLQALENR